MLASLEWLKQYVDINISVAELCDKITRVGLEVDTVTQLGKGLEGVITGKVMEIHRPARCSAGLPRSGRPDPPSPGQRPSVGLHAGLRPRRRAGADSYWRAKCTSI